MQPPFYRRQLEADLDRWIGQGLVPEASRSRILQDSDAGPGSAVDVPSLLLLLGALLVGAAIDIYVIAESQFDIMTRSIVLLSVAFLPVILALLLRRQDQSFARELAVLGAICGLTAALHGTDLPYIDSRDFTAERWLAVISSGILLAAVFRTQWAMFVSLIGSFVLLSNNARDPDVLIVAVSGAMLLLALVLAWRRNWHLVRWSGLAAACAFVVCAIHLILEQVAETSALTALLCSYGGIAAASALARNDKPGSFWRPAIIAAMIAACVGLWHTGADLKLLLNSDALVGIIAATVTAVFLVVYPPRDGKLDWLIPVGVVAASLVIFSEYSFAKGQVLVVLSGILVLWGITLGAILRYQAMILWGAVGLGFWVALSRNSARESWFDDGYLFAAAGLVTLAVAAFALWSQRRNQRVEAA